MINKIIKGKGRIVAFSLAVIGLVAIVNGVTQAEAVNLINNSSVESSQSSNPTDWTSSRWGDNKAQLQHKSDGHTGNRSLYVEMTSRTDGDAKWMHRAVNVKPNTEYTYTSWYKSNISTEIDLQYTTDQDSFAYDYVATIASSSEWTELSVKFTTPNNVKQVTVMHVVADPGWLQTDDFILSESVKQTVEPTGNLIDNPSLELVKGTSPASWNKNTWGDNTAKFSYEKSGRTGARSVKTTISKYKSGDAKWYFSHVDVQSGKTYKYADYHRSSVKTRVVLSYISKNGVYSYVELPSAEASGNDWASYQAEFTVPSDVTKVSVYHIIDQVGNLTIDDASLAIVEDTSSVEDANIQMLTINNNSFEEANDDMPVDWQKSRWGDNSATFEYVNSGHTGSKSAKISMSNYVDGDAKWYFNPIDTLKSGEQYMFSLWYKTNVAPRVIAMYGMADGSTHYADLPTAEPNSSSTTQWQEYKQSFSVPSGVKTTSIFMIINQNGWLQTDDYQITTYKPVGFNRPLLTLTFDDGHEDNISTALPIMNQHNIKSTQCYMSAAVEGKQQYVIDGILAFRDSGHEICSHTVSHPMMTSLDDSQLNYELTHSKQYLEQLTGKTVKNLASPYGDYDARVIKEIKKLYQSHRTVNAGYNSKDNFDIYRLKVQNILDTTSAEEVAGWIRQAQTDKTWLILVYHRVANNPGPYDSYVNVFEQHIQKILDSGIVVKTYQEALDEVTAQV